MDLSLTEYQKILKTTAQEFLKQECPWNIIKTIDESKDGFSKDLWMKIAKLGWLGMLIPESNDGMNNTITDMGILYEEMGRNLVPGVFFSSSVLCSLIIMEAGTPQQKQRYLPRIARGDSIFTFAFTESNYGWDTDCIHLSAKLRGDNFVLNGTKRFIYDALIADHIICVARTSDSSYPQNGISLFVVDKNTPGLSCHSLSAFSGERMYELKFDSVKVPVSNMLGQKDNGWQNLRKPLNNATVILSAYMLGGCQYLLDMTVFYAQTRIQFGQPIGAFQWVQGYIIDQVNYLEKARWFTYEALWKLGANKTEREQDESASLAKATASEAFHECSHLAHEVHAGIGVDKKYPLYLYSKKSKTLYSYLGDPYYHRRRIAELLEL